METGLGLCASVMTSMRCYGDWRYVRVLCGGCDLVSDEDAVMRGCNDGDG